MKSLPIEIKQGQFALSQVERLKNAAIYEKTSEGKPRGFEVIRIREQKAGTAVYPGNRIVEREAQEVYPASEQWGTYGWTLATLPEAREKLLAITAQDA
jgi:hypothetical protein